MHIHPDRAWITAMTPFWKGERFESGRPRVADAVLERLRTATIEQAWFVLRQHEYHRQFAGGWLQTHPGRQLVGRAVTSRFLPQRPDFDAVVVEQGATEGNESGDRQNTWIIEGLVEGDVMVTDIFGKVEDGTVIGDNLGTAIAARTRAGAVIDGGIRDLSGLVELPDVNYFCRGVHPTAIVDVTLAGINVPIRIDGVTVLPGDVVLGNDTGVIFIPAQLAEEVADAAEDVSMRDVFGKQRLSERVYSTADIDVQVWAADIESDFRAWRAAKGSPTDRGDRNT